MAAFYIVNKSSPLINPLTPMAESYHVRCFPDHREQFGTVWVWCLAQGHFDIWTGAAGDWTANTTISGRPTLSPEPQPPWQAGVCSRQSAVDGWVLHTHKDVGIWGTGVGEDEYSMWEEGLSWAWGWRAEEMGQYGWVEGDGGEKNGQRRKGAERRKEGTGRCPFGLLQVVRPQLRPRREWMCVCECARHCDEVKP